MNEIDYISHWSLQIMLLMFWDQCRRKLALPMNYRDNIQKIWSFYRDPHEHSSHRQSTLSQVILLRFHMRTYWALIWFYDTILTSTFLLRFFWTYFLQKFDFAREKLSSLGAKMFCREEERFREDHSQNSLLGFQLLHQCIWHNQLKSQKNHPLSRRSSLERIMIWNKNWHKDLFLFNIIKHIWLIFV